MLRALAAVGRRCHEQTDLFIVVGAAAILCNWLDRTTVDVDVVLSEPKLSLWQPAILDAAEELGLASTWMNDGAKGFSDVLSPDFRRRSRLVGTFAQLRVFAVSREDFILLKLFAMRVTDIIDVESLSPALTDSEVEFVVAQLPRLAHTHAGKAQRIELYLQERGRLKPLDRKQIL